MWAGGAAAGSRCRQSSAHCYDWRSLQKVQQNSNRDPSPATSTETCFVTGDPGPAPHGRARTHHRYQSAVLLGSRPPPAPLRGHGGGAARRGALARAAARAPRRWSRWRLESVRGVQRAACSRQPRRVLQWVDRVEHGQVQLTCTQHCSTAASMALQLRHIALQPQVTTLLPGPWSMLNGLYAYT